MRLRFVGSFECFFWQCIASSVTIWPATSSSSSSFCTAGISLDFSSISICASTSAVSVAKALSICLALASLKASKLPLSALPSSAKTRVPAAASLLFRSAACSRKIFSTSAGSSPCRIKGTDDWDSQSARLGIRDRMIAGSCGSSGLASGLALARLGLAADAIDARVAGLLGYQRQAELLAHHAGEEAAHRVLLPAGRLHDGRDGRTLPALQHGDHRRLLRLRLPGFGEPARLAGPLAGGRGPARSRAGLALGPRPGLGGARLG